MGGSACGGMVSRLEHVHVMTRGAVISPNVQVLCAKCHWPCGVALQMPM